MQGRLTTEEYAQLKARYPKRVLDVELDAMRTAQSILRGEDIAPVNAIRSSGWLSDGRTRKRGAHISNNKRDAVLALLYHRDDELYGFDNALNRKISTKDDYASACNVSSTSFVTGGEFPHTTLSHSPLKDTVLTSIRSVAACGQFAIVSHPGVLELARQNGYAKVPYYENTGSEILTVSPAFIEHDSQAARLVDHLMEYMECVYDERVDVAPSYSMFTPTKRSTICSPIYTPDVPVPLALAKCWMMRKMLSRCGTTCSAALIPLAFAGVSGDNMKALAGMLMECRDEEMTHLGDILNDGVDADMLPQWVIDATARLLVLVPIWDYAMHAEGMDIDDMPRTQKTLEAFEKLYEECGMEFYLKSVADGVPLSDVIA